MQNRKKQLKINKLSIIMPAYKAEKFVVDSMDRLVKVLSGTSYDYEIICVVDGTNIDDSFKHAKAYSKKNPKAIKVVGYEENRGKGHAVRYGLARATGNVIGYLDVGNEINPQGLLLLLEHLKWYNADAVVASKRHPASKVSYPWQRRIMSFGYQLLVRLLFGVKVRDTQVGMKFFKREVLEQVLPRILVKKFAFDIEILAVSNYLGFKNIYESPVEINMKFGGGISTVTSKGFLVNVFFMVWDTVAIFYRLRILRYYSDSNKRNWTTPDYLIIPRK